MRWARSTRALDKAVYLLANGVGKIRRGHFGSVEPTQRWRTSLLSTGEVSVDERLRTRGGRSTAGQEVRHRLSPKPGKTEMNFVSRLRAGMPCSRVTTRPIARTSRT